MINLYRAVAWTKNIHREAALDSLRNVLAVMGAGTILADFGTMKAWLLLPMTGVAFLIGCLIMSAISTVRQRNRPKTGQSCPIRRRLRNKPAASSAVVIKTGKN